MRQGNIHFNVTNKVQQQGLDGAVVTTMEIWHETLCKALITQEDASEAHLMKTVCPILASLEDQFIALLFRHRDVDVTLDKTRMFGHMRQAPDDLTCWLHTMAAWQGCCHKTSSTHHQCLVESIVAVFPLVNSVMGQTVCPFTSTVGGNHSVWWGNTSAAFHAMAGDVAQEVKNIGLGGRFWQLGETMQKCLRLIVWVPRH